MKASVAIRSRFARAVVLAIPIVAAAMSGPAAAVDLFPGADPSLAIANAVPSALLSVDQNRSTVVDRVVSNWGDALAGSDAGLNREQLRTLLMGLRADHLLAASLAGALDGLRNAIAVAQTATPPNTTDKAQPKALGDSARDLVYTPVVPCRIVDTVKVGGAIPGGTRRSFIGTTATNFSAQGGSATTCGIPTSAAVVQAIATVVDPPAQGILTIYPFNVPQPAALNLVYPANRITTTAVTIQLTKGQASEFTAFLEQTTFLQVDVVGYFAANQATGLQCVNVVSAGTSCAPNTYCNDDAPACTSGYTLTGRFCNTTGIQFYMTDVREHACYGRNADTITQTLTATSRCCRVPGL